MSGALARAPSRWAVAAVAAVVACGCARGPGPAPPRSCQALVADATTTVVELDQGGALEFIATGEVAAVRRGGHWLVDVHNAQLLDNRELTDAQKAVALGLLVDPRAAPAPDSPPHDQLARAKPMVPVASVATYDEIEGGARVSFRVLDPKDRAALRVELGRHVCGRSS